jgi:glycosyltransferase involved in cell wall biosynthesis
VFVVDIDFRQHSKRFYQVGAWSLKSYIVNRLFYDPLRWLQVWLAPRMSQLVMLKSASMVRDLGGGRPHVKNFFDAAHSEEHVLSADSLQTRAAWLRNGGGPLRLAYFGRLVSNKGLDRAVEAVRLARQHGEDVQLLVIGDGPCLEPLRRQAADAGLAGVISFTPQIRYGAPLFELLNDVHLTVAAPLIEDTPRAAFDSMARGIPIVAFDISYFRDLAEISGAVALAEWPRPAALAREIVALGRDRERLAVMAERGVSFARHNTQRVWLERRTQWTMQFALAGLQGRPSA